MSKLAGLLVAAGVVLCTVFCAAGCGTRDRADERRVSSADPNRSDSKPLPPVAGATGPRIVILGDSLTAGLGLPISRAYPSLLQRDIDEAGLKYTIVNAGVSGDTSAGALSRLDWALDGDVRILVVALGGNDGLRGLPTAELSSNLSQIIERAQSRGVTVILAGMEAPPNYGLDYTLAFHKVFPELAKKYRVKLIPFLLERVAGIGDLNQADGIHPTAEGAEIVANTVWSALKPAVEDDARRAGPGKAPSS
jgi:acyl-CoA thioesterase-1